MKLKVIPVILILVLCSSCYLLGPSRVKRYRRAERNKPLDAAIIPGLPFNNGKWDTLLKERILWSVYLYKKGIVKNIIYSGAAVYTPYIEGKAMAIYARALGVDPKHIFIDSQAQHSTENIYYGYQIAKKHGFKKIAIATDPFQSFMVYGFSKKSYFKNRFYFLPIIYDSLQTLQYKQPEVNTQPAHVKNFVSIEDRLTFWQRLKGTMGGNIKHKEAAKN